MKSKTTPRHPLHLLKGYKLFLEGAAESEMKAVVSEAELSKIIEFHNNTDGGAYRAGLKAGIEKYTAKKMLKMFKEWQAGLPLSYGQKNGREAHPYLTHAFTMLLDGATDDEMLANGCCDFEIDLVKNFLPFSLISDNMLLATIAERTHITVSTVANLLRIYREK